MDTVAAMLRRSPFPPGWFLPLIVLAALSGRAQIDPPGFRPRPYGSHALVQATLHVRPGVVVSNATVVIRDGRIVAAGAGVPAPADARVWECAGLTIYPGFIDPYVVGATNRVADAAADGTTEASGGASAGGPKFFGVAGQERDPGTAGPAHGIPDVTPEFRVGRVWGQPAALTKEFRELGFAVAHIVPGEGILRGQSAVMTLGEGSPNEAILRTDAAQVVAFRAVPGFEGYPNSLMGVIATIRQAGFDAQHYRVDWENFRSRPNARSRPAHNESLEALQDAGHGQPVFFEPGSVLMVDRAVRVADELGLTNRVIVASGEEWRRPDLAALAKGPFVVPVDFPALPKLPDDRAWDQVSLDDLRAWDWAAENPAMLRNAGLEVALTTHALSDRKAFRKNLRAALDRGLDATHALAALTTVPAKLLGLGDTLGTVEAGRIANLTVVAGDYFDPESKIRGVWIDGRPYEFAADKPAEGTNETSEAKQKAETKKTEQRDLAAKRLARSPLSGRGPLTNPPAVVVRGATVWTSGAAGIVTNASLVVVGGKVVSVTAGGSELPANAFVIEGPGLHVTPGIIDAHSHSMILGGVNEATLPSTAMVRIGDVVDSESENIRQQLAGGTTLVNLLHGSANPIGGQSAVIKLRDGEGPEGLKIAGAPGGIKFALGENVKQSNAGDRNVTRFPQTRMGVPTFFVNRFTAARQYLEAWKDWRETGVAPRRDLELEAIGEILNGERLIHCHSYRQDEILAFLRTMESFGVRVATLQHILEGYKVADEIARHGAGASSFSDWWAFKYEVIDAIPHNGSLLHERGVSVSFNSDSSDHARRMNLEAAKAVKYGGTSETEALKFVTLNPAQQLGLGDRVGSLEAGKDGDFVVWSGHPLDSRSVCLQTWIEGRQYFDRTREAERTRALAEEHSALVAKAKKLAGGAGDASASDKAREKFFLRVFENARQLGVAHCEDCNLSDEN